MVRVPEGFHTNLVVLEPQGSIPAHRNDGLDVLLVGWRGAGVAAVDDEAVELASGTALLVPRGTVRSITAGEGGLRYLRVHARRGPLTIGVPAQVDVDGGDHRPRARITHRLRAGVPTSDRGSGRVD